MKSAASLLAISLVPALAGCGGNTQTYEYPSVSMAPTIAYHEHVTIDLDAYEDAAPAVGDIVAFHPPPGAENLGECGVQHPPSQACPEAIDGSSSITFIKRIVAGPGDELSIRDGLPVRKGKATLANLVRKCSQQACNLPQPITIAPGHYFLMGDNSGASSDSRFWGPIPRASILGELED